MFSVLCFLRKLKSEIHGVSFAWPHAVLAVCVVGVLSDPDATVWAIRTACACSQSSSGDEESWNHSKHHHIWVLQ